MDIDPGILIDLEFGAWLSGIRQGSNHPIATASTMTGISAKRLKDLEDGDAFPSITKKECEQLARFYRIPIDLLINRASELQQ